MSILSKIRRILGLSVKRYTGPIYKLKCEDCGWERKKYVKRPRIGDPLYYCKRCVNEIGEHPLLLHVQIDNEWGILDDITEIHCNPGLESDHRSFSDWKQWEIKIYEKPYRKVLYVNVMVFNEMIRCSYIGKEQK